MVKRRTEPCARKKPTTRTALRNKKTTNSHGATVTPIQVSLRKCVVKVRRLRVEENTPPKEVQNVPDAMENSTFEPARNSTMCAPEQIRTPSPGKKLQGKCDHSLFRQRLII